jgi:hypothetical protein
MKTREELFTAGVQLTERFCVENGLATPTIKRIHPSDRMFHLGSCAFYRPYTISIMVEKCAARGCGGPAWSCPGYAVDRTPYGVLQHELGHHVDTLKTGDVTTQNLMERLFSRQIFLQSKEEPLTKYLGTDKRAATFFMEWFAENFRLYVTNPDLSLKLRPKFYMALFSSGVYPVIESGWDEVLQSNDAPVRNIEQARKNIR